MYEVQVREADARNSSLLATHACDVAARCRIHNGLRVFISDGNTEMDGDEGIGWLSAAVGETIVVRVGIPLDDDVQAKVGQVSTRAIPSVAWD